MEPSTALDIVWPGFPRMVRPLPAPAEKAAPAGQRARDVASERPAAGITRAAPDGDARSLRELVSRMANRDEAALTDFYDATIARVYGLALRIVRSRAEAEEVAVDTMHQAWREAGRYDATRGAPLAWLLTICRSRALDLLRARDAAMTHDDPHSLRSADDAEFGDGDPQDLVAAIQSHTALAAVLAKLAPAQRQMLGLAFFRGLTHEEIAAHAALPLGTVKSQIRRALAAMRDGLAGE